MNQQGATNKHGGQLTANTLKKVIYRVRHRCGLNDLIPDWSELDGHDALHRQGLLLMLLGVLVCLCRVLKMIRLPMATSIKQD